MIVTTSILKERYKDYVNPLDKIKRDNKEGKVIRLTRGLYETDKNVSPCFLASAIYGPSYLSFDFALSYYGLIPERVYVVTSASFKLRKTKVVNNYFGSYSYSDIPPSVYPEEITFISDGIHDVMIATKEKAICDSLYKWSPVKSIKQLKELMFDDKRIDILEFQKCDFVKLNALSKLYNKRNLSLLNKLIEREYLSNEQIN